LAGIIPLSGFWSKDEILASLSTDAFGLGTAADVVLVLGIAGAFVTAFYMARAVHLAFFGSYKGEMRPHEGPAVMTYPLVGLAVFAVIAGWVNIPGAFTAFTGWLGARVHAALDPHADALDWGLVGVGTLAALVGIVAGTALYGRDASTQAGRDRFRVPLLYPLLQRKYYFDDLYGYGLVKPIRGPIARAVNWTNDVVIDGVVNAFGAAARRLSLLVYGGLDRRGIDLTINAAAAATGRAGSALRRAQTGKVQQYAAALFAGAVLLVVGFLIFS
jgi:NADH-quinone oxidoreductase subunit L